MIWIYFRKLQYIFPKAIFLKEHLTKGFWAELSIDFQMKFKDADRGFVPIQVLFCLKKKNVKKSPMILLCVVCRRCLISVQILQEFVVK